MNYSLISEINYWNNHTVNSNEFKSEKESTEYLKWRNDQYPLFANICLGGNNYSLSKNEKVIIDYGCGPGNDLIGLLLNSNADTIYGIDVSEKALNLSRKRLNLYKNNEKVKLINIKNEKFSENFLNKFIKNNSVDYIQSLGVLHHIPKEIIFVILKNFYNLLKKNKKCITEVHNKDSIWYHLYVGYVIKILEEGTSGKALQVAKNKTGKNNPSTDEIFHYSTDGLDCPISYSFTSNEWIKICNNIGFNTEHIGNYISKYELMIIKKYMKKALNDNRLDKIHREFLEKIKIINNIPYYDGNVAGIGLCHKLNKI